MTKYNIIYADPPWKQTKGGKRKCRPNQRKELDYKTIPLQEIKYILENFRDKAEENHIMFCWTIDKYLFEAEQILKELGYKLHARIIWDKTNGVAPAFTVRYSHEYLLYCYYGKFTPIAKEMRGKYTTIIREQATKHSKKPQIAYEMIENLYPNTNKIELFARNKRDNWDAWGDEVECNIELKE